MADQDEQDNSAIAIPRENDRPNRLIVEEAFDDDNSVIALSPAKMYQLQLSIGDTVLLKGSRSRKKTVCTVLPDDTVPNEKIRMNRIIRYNLRVRFSDIVSVRPYLNIKYGKEVHVRVYRTPEDLPGNLFGVYLKPYFDNKYRPIHKGDTFIVREGMQAVKFQVAEIDPSPFCIVGPDTVIYYEVNPMREEEERASSNVRYDFVGGYRKQLTGTNRIAEELLHHFSRMRARLEKLKRENQELRNLHQELKNKTQGIHQRLSRLRHLHTCRRHRRRAQYTQYSALLTSSSFTFIRRREHSRMSGGVGRRRYL